MIKKLHGNAIFALQGIKDRNVASLVPTLQLNVKKICESIPTDRPVTILEYGPGTGPFTEYFVKHLHPDSRVIAIDRNKRFVKYLKNRFEKRNDTGVVRVEVLDGDARKARQYLDERKINLVDYCFSGIPLSYFPKQKRLDLIENTKNLIKPDGELVVYQVSSLAAKSLREVFGNAQLEIYPINVPILFVMRSQRHQPAKD